MNAKRQPTSAAARFARRSLFVAALLAVGCSSGGSLGERRDRPAVASTQPTTGPTASLLSFQMFAVTAAPPVEWQQRTNSINDRSEHVTWLSPTGHSAFGVIYFKLPFPVGHEMAFQRGFLAEMRKREGEPVVLDKRWDDEIGGLRFTVRSPKYQVEAKFFVKGLRGYAVYAGSRSDLPIDEAELAVARAARESTRFERELKPGEAPAAAAE